MQGRSPSEWRHTHIIDGKETEGIRPTFVRAQLKSPLIFPFQNKKRAKYLYMGGWPAFQKTCASGECAD
jgi:hypothetical protein